ncbi:MAG: bifunctional diaminohydroxyphosphoribosylaminopyrimidine deaminase/5-amino-6-(5-phosphoribosylamino)uracil reductase RibD [Candidatus Methylacidiphilales bacterium]|nr:bifunctional diaminohydroxyphosphoribosylaminopyrimidine deaminase/5-amino-6-(5-phosphoribosylamino)uracil reductase RibD [Candidatus Methylacidiphilales bacterium]
MAFSQVDTMWMRKALELAALGSGCTSPNPRVGSVIVCNGTLLGFGWHKKAGTPHAEVNAVRSAKERGHTDLSCATIYVTLEPCCTHGRTPPCTDLILAERFRRVVVAAVDPNPRHAGHGLDILRGAGIQVESGLLEEESAYLNRDFNHFMRTGLPWVTAKMALSLDGSIAPRRGDSPWLTSAPARNRAHQLRHLSDAIIVGAGTVRTDNPKLTIRLLQSGPAAMFVREANREDSVAMVEKDGELISATSIMGLMLAAGEGSELRIADMGCGVDPVRIIAQKPQPLRVVLTRSATFPDTEAERVAALFTDEHRERTLIMRNGEPLAVLQDLAKRQVLNVLLEGGGQVLGSFFQAGLVNEAAFFLAPVMLGTSSPPVAMSDGYPAFAGAALDRVTYEKLGPDLLMHALIRPADPGQGPQP